MICNVKRSFVIFLFLTSLLVSVASAETITFTDLGMATEFTSGKTGTTPVGIFYIDSDKDPLEISIRTYRIQVYKLTVYVNDAPIIESGQLAGGDGTLSITLPPELLKIGENTIYVKGTSMSRGNDGFGDTNHLVIYGTSTITSDSLYTPYGVISISSSPTDSNVYLDDAFKGVTPLTISDVPIGSHVIKLTKDSYHDKTKSVMVVDDDIASVSETLTQITGSIAVSSSPSNAYVYLGDAIKGTTPLTIDNVPIGTHSIKLTKDGYYNNTKSVIVTEDTVEKVSLSIESVEGAALVDNALDTSNNYGYLGGIGAFALLLFFMAIIKSKRKVRVDNPTTPKKSIKPNIAPKITSAFGYKGATIQYKVKVENPTSEPIADIKINLYVPDVFLASESTKTITMLKPSESKTATFEIRPTGECGDCEVSGKVVYYDYSTKKTTGIDIPPKSLSIVCPMLKGKEIDESEWHSIVSNLIETEESTREIDMPAETLFTMASRIVKDMHMHRLEPEVTNSSQLFNGVARFYGEGIKGLKYAAQVEVVGGAKKSRLILKTWAEKEEALTGFYHGLLDEIEKRVQVKGYIDDSIVQNFYHYGDKIGTQVKDSIVQRSNIGAGGDVDVAEKKCPTCDTVAEGNGKYCNECGGKLY